MKSTAMWFKFVRLGHRLPSGSPLRSDTLITFVLAAAYFQMVWGAAILDPRNIRWLLEVQHDLMLYLTTTSYYRFSSWSFPITRFDSLLYPVGTSIAVADGVPLLAVPYKLLDPLLPRGAFQYFGLWLFVCVWLQALIAKRTFSLLKLSVPLQWIGTLLLMANLPQAFAIWHFPLWAHFLYLYGFYLVLHPELPLRKTCILLAVAPWVTPYLFVMVLATCTALFIHHRRTPRLLRKAGLAMAVTVTSCFMVGYFHFSTGVASEGEYMSDLTSLFNAGITGRLGPQLSTLRDYDEGYGYLGLGGIALFALLLLKPIVPIWRKREVHALPLLFVCSLMLFYAIGANPLFRGQHLGRVEWLHDAIQPFLARLRATGRFIWPIWTYIMLFGVRAIHELLRSRGHALVAGCVVLALQIADVGPWLADPVRPIPPGGKIAPVSQQVEKQLTVDSKFLMLEPAALCKRGPSYRRNMWGLALFGIEHRLSSNSDFGSLARFSREDQKAVCRATKKLWSRRRSHPEVIFVELP